MSGLDASSNSQLTFLLWFFCCYIAFGCHIALGCTPYLVVTLHLVATLCLVATLHPVATLHLVADTVTLFPPISPCLPFLPRDWLLVIFCCYTAPGYHTVFGCYTAPSVATLHLIATLYFIS